jgi:hypothetical protein
MLRGFEQNTGQEVFRTFAVTNGLTGTTCSPEQDAVALTFRGVGDSAD